MHKQAYQWVADHAYPNVYAVLDIGGRDINGTVRALFPTARLYTSLDLHDGPAVDIVADAATWTPDRAYDVVVCAEVFEHTKVWPDICLTAYNALAPGGQFIATMAGPGRGPHSGIDGMSLHPGEHYENVEPHDLREVLLACGFRDIVVDQQRSPADVRCTAVR